jgi:hypothetical protein
MKSQTIRLIDVLFLGPTMIYFSLTGRKTQLERAFFLVSGAATILYNLRNYQLAVKSDEK